MSRLAPTHILALDGEDLRGLPLSLRKTNLAQMPRGRPDGIFVAPFEQGEIEPGSRNRKHPAMYRVKGASP